MHDPSDRSVLTFCCKVQIKASKSIGILSVTSCTIPPVFSTLTLTCITILILIDELPIEYLNQSMLAKKEIESDLRYFIRRSAKNSNLFDL